MGAFFQLKHANVMMHVTMPSSTAAPRLKKRELIDFLESLVQGGVAHGPTFISSDAEWAQRMGVKVQNAAAKASPLGRSGELADPKIVEDVLKDLRRELSDYDFFGLVVGNQHPDDEISALARHFAYRTKARALFLIPIPAPTDQPVTILDPIPAVAPALEQRHDWPGLLVWSRSGMSAFAPLKEAENLCTQLLQAASGAPQRLSVDEIISTFRSKDRGVRLLHLSDLHYGRTEAAESEALLLAELDLHLDNVKRVVITGDLFDNPTRSDQVLFRNFRAALLRRSGKDPIVVPGNHDQKWLGTLPASLRQVADLEWSNLVIDDDMQCVFFCFDSSRDANIAQGIVTKDQLRDVGTAFQTNVAANRAIGDFLPIALVHHHPFSFNVVNETRIQRLLGKIGLNEEDFLCMKESEQFVAWLAKRRISLVLHGHKHVQRHVEQCVSVDPQHAQYVRVTAIGCGASLGAEGYPISFNILSWDAVSRTWSASFFADPGDGSGFARQMITSQAVGNPGETA